MRSPHGTPLALSPHDVPDGGRLLVHSCEDCACPVNRREGEPPRLDAAPPGALVRAAHVLDLAVDDGWRVLFAPQGGGGALVVNPAAHELVERLRTPAALEDLVAEGAGADHVAPVLARLLEHDVVHPAGAAPAPPFRRSTELTAWLHVTNACNLRCSYCYVDKTDDAMDEATARRAVDALMRSAQAHGFRSLRLKYAGGEASMNTAVMLAMHDHAVVECARADLGLSTVLLTNGVAVPDRLVRALADRGIAVMVSLDGLGAAHDGQRRTVGGRPSSALVVRSIDRLVAGGVPPHLSITITGRNAAEVAPVVRFALERELTFSFNFFRDDACADGATDLRFEEQAMVDGLRAAMAAIGEALPRWSVLGSILDRGQLLEPRQRSCGAGDDYVVVDQRGRIAKCHMDLETTIGDLWSTDPVTAVRTSPLGMRNLLVDDKEGCRGCTWKHWCSGGCSLATFRATGRWDVRSPNCSIYTTIYPEALLLEGRRLLAHAVAP